MLKAEYVCDICEKVFLKNSAIYGIGITSLHNDNRLTLCNINCTTKHLCNCCLSQLSQICDKLREPKEYT